MPRSKAITPELADRVRKVLQGFLDKGWTQAMIGKHLGVPQVTISDIVRGYCNAGEQTAKKVLKEDLPARLPKPRNEKRGRREKLPSKRQKNKKDRVNDSRDERPGDLRCLPRRSREQRQLLVQPRTEDQQVVRLPKVRRTELDLQNEARMLAGHNQILIKVHSCLGCRTRFESVGDRMCPKCKGESVPVLSGTEIY